MPEVGSRPLFRIVDKQELFTELMENIYWYIQPSGTALTAASVGASFVASVVTPLLNVQHEALNHYALDVEQVNVVDNFATLLPDLDGANTGVILPSFNALTCSLVRTTKETRNGRKAIAGGREVDSTGNSWEATYLAAAVTALGTFDNTLTPGGVEDIVPVIVRQTKDPDTGEVLPVADWLYNPISAVLINPRISSQNSRKVF